MSIIGSNVAQSVAGLSQAEKIEAREKRPSEPKSVQRRTRKDEFDHTVAEVDTAQAVRGLKGNDQEEAHEDRQEHASYNQQGAPRPDGETPKLDIEG